MAAHRIRGGIRYPLLCVTACAGALLTPGSAQAAGTWHAAVEVPGLGALNAGGNAQLGTVSCASAGNCSAGGTYIDSGGYNQAFVVDQVNGTWHTAQEVPGTAALNDTFAGTSSISCFSVGNCSAGGGYADIGYNHFAFVADRVSGTWHNAKETPGTAALNTGSEAGTESVSCRTGGNCSAGGSYWDANQNQQVFVVNRVSGAWKTAFEVPGTGTLNAGGFAAVQSVSCGSAGNCSLGGAYTDAAGHQQVFVANRVSGAWHTAIKIPGTATLNAGGHAEFDALSCGAAANCSAVGIYTDASAVRHPFIANRINGTWHAAFEAPGVAALSGGHNADFLTISCPSAGNCSAGGDYVDSSGHVQGFVISEVNGHWGNALTVPGLAALNTGNLADVLAVSCASAGNCSAGGQYFVGSLDSEAFVVDQVNGVWGNARELPGIGTLNAGASARLTSMSCRSASACSAGGTYVDGAHHLQAFVVNRS